MKKQHFLFFLLLAFITKATSQELIPMAVDSVSIKADKFFGFDAYKNYYYSKNNVVLKKVKQVRYNFKIFL